MYRAVYIMKYKYEQSALSRVALARRFIYKVMVLGTLHDPDIFVKLSQIWTNLYYIIVSQYCFCCVELCKDEP